MYIENHYLAIYSLYHFVRIGSFPFRKKREHDGLRRFPLDKTYTDVERTPYLGPYERFPDVLIHRGRIKDVL